MGLVPHLSAVRLPRHRQYVAAMLNYMDDVVGNVASALKDAGLWNNTLMVWSSDNGAAVELCTGMNLPRE